MRSLGVRSIAALMLVAVLSPQAFGQTADAIKIGVLADVNGALADIGGQGSVEAVKMAVEDFGGKALGKPIEIVSADGRNSLDVASKIARDWYDSGVDVITDIPTSDVAVAVMQLARERKKIALVTSAGSSDITGKSCSPYAAHWTWDTYAMSHGTVDSIAKRGGKDWFFITANYVFGQAFERDAAAVVVANGGRVHGAVRHTLGTLDFSSFFLQAQGSRANIVGFANAGSDTINAIRQAVAFGLPQGGTQLVALVAFISDIHSLGLRDAQGLMLTEAFYWDLDEATRTWSQRFFARTKRMPSMTQAGAYSAVLHYLKAVQAAGTRDADQVMAQMRAMPVNDVMTHGGRLRIDGRVLRDMYLFRVKKPEESKSEWDLYKLVAKIPAEQAFRPLSEGGCPLVK
ncbi:ABC transporter substrate-binding protein [Bradyrhizobium prioriisuperbiae]|uniref:ABC transporter substrate-binding protein n=1 Tax=Bradyrhizobium prioriisuperbiae TaxID=2854389 RepID=UPI0028EF4F24|nr:ABC transporter substrate-binding protein [Bradyrhizobium prioritasuperba]